MKTETTAPTPSISEQLATMDAQREAIARAAAAEQQAILDRAHEMRSKLAPLYQKFPRRAELIQHIANGEALKLGFARDAALLREAMDEVFALGPNGGAVGAMLNLFRIRPDQAEAARGLILVEEFLERKRAALGNITAEILDYAKRHSIENELPEDLKK